MTNLSDHIRSSTRTGHIEFFIEERNTEFVTSRMPVAAGILNPFGRVQAGAMIWLADVTASVLALEGETLGEGGKGFPLAIDLHSTLVGNQADGEITAQARIVHRGQNVIVVRTRLTGHAGKLLAEVTTTHAKAR